MAGETRTLGDWEVRIDADGHCELPAGMTSVPAEAFYHWDGDGRGCSSLKSVTFPGSVTVIGGGAFCGCS